MPSAVDLLDVKLALGMDQAIRTDDYELQTKIWGAEAEYAEHVRPLPGPYVRTGTLPMFLPRGVVAGSVVVTDAGGAPLTVQHDVLTGQVSSSAYYASTGYVTVSCTIGPIPDNHLTAIIADVAEYWTRTQRGGGPSRPSFGGDASFEPDTPARPLVMFPRIRALAGPVIA